MRSGACFKFLYSEVYSMCKDLVRCAKTIRTHNNVTNKLCLNCLFIRMSSIWECVIRKQFEKVQLAEGF